MTFPTLTELAARGTEKWRAYSPDVLPMFVAESDFATCPEVKQAIADAVEREMFGYAYPDERLGQAVSEFYAQSYGWRPNPEWVRAVPDVVRGVCLSISHLTREDSAVIVPVPSYMPFFQIPGVTGRDIVHVPVEDLTGDLRETEAALKAGAGSIILVNPYNPLGLVFEQETLQQICDLARDYDARVIVDEIHAPLVLNPQCRHHVAAAVAPDVCITITASSKAWNVAGLKCAQIIFSNDNDVVTWDALPSVTRGGVSILGQEAAIACYSACQSFIQDQTAYLWETVNWLREELPARIPGIRIAGACDATYLMWLDFSGTSIAKVTNRPAEYLLEHAKVALNEGAAFSPEDQCLGDHHARLNCACSRDNLAEAIDRIAAALPQ